MKKLNRRKKVFLSIGIIGSIVIIIVLTYLTSRMYKSELKKYNEEDYMVIENVISEYTSKNKDMSDFSDINVNGLEIEYKKTRSTGVTEVLFKYNNASIILTIDSSNHIISKTRNFNSFEQYESCCHYGFVGITIVYGAFALLTFFIILLLIYLSIVW